VLTYNLKEFSFDTVLMVNYIDGNLTLNSLNLTIEDKKIVQTWGFCRNATWIATEVNVPDFFKGILKEDQVFDSAILYKIFEEEQTVFFNRKIGWVCLGDVLAANEAVELSLNACKRIHGEKRIIKCFK
jgi:hypothetical protein